MPNRTDESGLGSVSGLICEDPDTLVRGTEYGSPDPDPHQNVTDPQNTASLFILRAFLAFWIRFRPQQAQSMQHCRCTGTNSSKCVPMKVGSAPLSSVSGLWCSSRIRILTFYPSRIPDSGSRGQKGTWSRIRICNTDSKLNQCAWIPVLITVNGFFYA